MSAKGISGVGLAAGSIGLVYLWSALKGASVTATLRDVIAGKEPAGTNVNPISGVSYLGTTGATPGASAGIGVASASAANILSIAASYKGQKYIFGAGHGKPCASSATDCSGYVSCVLYKAGVMKTTMATGGLAHIGVGVPYSQRQPGDIIVWNGGTGGGHTGIIIDGGTMWNNPCTICGGVQISKYPYGTRTAAAAVIRRVTK